MNHLITEWKVRKNPANRTERKKWMMQKIKWVKTSNRKCGIITRPIHIESTAWLSIQTARCRLYNSTIVQSYRLEFIHYESSRASRQIYRFSFFFVLLEIISSAHNHFGTLISTIYCLPQLMSRVEPNRLRSKSTKKYQINGESNGFCRCNTYTVQPRMRQVILCLLFQWFIQEVEKSHSSSRICQ